MGSFSFSNSVISGNLAQRVLIGGRRRSDIYCNSISLAIGSNGSTASLAIPSASWDGGKSGLRGREVIVQVAYGGGSFKTEFIGYINDVQGSIDANTLAVEAVSIIGMADGFYIGEANPSGGLVAGYPEKAYLDGELTPTGWSLKTILRDWFSVSTPTWRNGGYGNGTLRSQVRSRLKLGTLSALSSSYNSFPLGEVIFRQSTLRSALDQIIGIVGNVSFRERFVGNDTYLDFFELGDPGAPERVLRVAGPNESIVGTNIATIDHTETSDDVLTRLIGYGSDRKCMITITTDDALEPAWDASLESAVLNNLESTKEGKESVRTEFSESRAKVFREFNISSDFRNYIIDKDLALELTDGAKLGIQVIIWDNEYSYDAGVYTINAAPLPTLVAGAELDIENLRIRLKEPAVKLVAAGVDGSNVPYVELEPAKIGLTIAVNMEKMYHEAANSNTLELDGIEDISEVIENHSFGYLQTTNVGFPINGVTYPCIYRVGTVWTQQVVPTVLQNDEAPLREFTELALIEKNSIKTNYTINTAFYSQAYRLGDRVRIIGQNDYQHGTHQITSIAHDLTNNHATTLSTDNSVPLIANTILSSGE